MTQPTHLKLAIINRSRVLVVDEPVPNQPPAIEALGKILAALHACTRRALHFQLRHPDDGRSVLVLEHGASKFEPLKGR